MDVKSNFDVIIIGAGIAGASLAYFLSERGMNDILILEKEEQPGYHSTGRAVAVLVELDFIPTVFQLKLLSADFLRNPPDGFSEYPLLQESGILMLSQGELWESVKNLVPTLRQSGVIANELSQHEAVLMVPALSAKNFDGAIHLPKDGHLDINELLWSYIKHAKRKGALLQCKEKVRGLKVNKDRCCGVTADSGEYTSNWVVNAGGAWSGNIRKMAGKSPISLTPYRRTIITFRAPEGLDVKQWPLCADISHDLYFSPESSGLLASPMDEDPIEPCDAHPDEMVVAQTIDRLERLTPKLVPKSLERKWAGLRTFAPDQAMLIGEDPAVKGFFWLSGQGGAGIETSPAVGQIAADLITTGQSDLMDVNLISPRRFSL